MSRPPAEEEEEPGPLAAASDAVKDTTDDNTAAVPNQTMVIEVLMAKAVEITSTCYTFKFLWTTRMLKSSSLTPFRTIECFPYPSQFHTQLQYFTVIF